MLLLLLWHAWEKTGLFMNESMRSFLLANVPFVRKDHMCILLETFRIFCFYKCLVLWLVLVVSGWCWWQLWQLEDLCTQCCHGPCDLYLSFSFFRLFSCGTSKEGESHLVEWNESEGAIKRTYSGFRKRSLGVVQFDTTKNHFLAAGDEFQIKFWDMDNTNILTITDADGGLPVSVFYTLLTIITSH